MYLSRAGDAPPRSVGRVPATVVALGVVSLLTDVSSEMVTAYLPLYLIYTLQISSVQFGLLDGLYTGATAALRLVGGHLADRWRRPRAVAATGYLMSAVTRLGTLAVGASALGIGSMVALDRAGKGLRTAPRDALIAQAAAPGRLGVAFGVHRALDTTGALIGPLITFLVLASYGTAPGPVFVVSFGFAVLGLIALAGLVPSGMSRPATPRPATPPAPAPSIAAGFALLRDPAVRRVTVVAALLGLVTLSDAFLFLLLQKTSGVPPAWLPLLPLGTAGVFLLAATPAGRLADRHGRRVLFLAGHGALLAAYGLMAAGAAGLGGVVAVLVLHGLFYAATDGVLAAWVARLVPENLRASGLAVVQTAQALARFASSVVVGFVLLAVSANGVTLAACAALGVALAAGIALLRRD